MEAVAILVGSDPNVASGMITFTQLVGKQSTTVTGTVSGLTPGKHGFHVHEFGDYSGGCDSTGAHYNPFNKDHGGITGKNRHVGDMGNIFADSEGVAKIDIVVKKMPLQGKTSIIGRAVVVHADEDDLGKGSFPDSSTTGHSGARLSCGVIGITNADPPSQ